MKTVGSRQQAAGSLRRNARRRRLLPALFCFLFLLPAAHCLLPTARAAGAWARQSSGSLAWLHAVFFLDERRGWAVGGNGVLIATEDGGVSWRARPRPTEDTLHDVYFTDERNGWLVCERSIYDLKELDDTRTYLLRTKDGGRSWDRVNVLGKQDDDALLVRALFTHEGRGWAFGEGGTLYTTRDGGATWERQRVPTRHLLLGGLFLDGEQGWLVGAGSTLLQTSDGGETWNIGTLLGFVPPASAGPDARRVRFTATSFVDRSRGWAVGAEGQVFATRNGGRTWTPQESNTTADLLDVKFLDGREGWASGAGGTLLHTVDGGSRWEIVPSGTTHALERLCFVGRARGWAVGFGGTILSYSPGQAEAQRPGLKR